MTQLYVLFEHASGFGLFKVSEFEEVGAFIPQVEDAVGDAAKFQRIVKLIGYKPFTSAASALENINAISEGLLTSELSAFLETNLPSLGKKSKLQIGVSDVKLGAAINEAYSVSVTHVGVVPEVVRGIRQHLTAYVKGLTPASMKQTELGLGHAYSRGKVKFNVNRVDNMIIQSISTLDQLDKDINTFAMRMKEWYSYHFPELAKLVTDSYQYSLCTDYIKDRKGLSEESLEKLEEIVMDPAKAQAILDASRMSMGMDISAIDLMNIERFAKRVISLSAYRKQLSEYLKKKMSVIAPNLAVLIGEMVGARLISHSGSLTNLAKYPASTVQILGAEKALFRAIKTRSNTPKYGLIYHASFISRAGTANKGRISRYLANKCSIASRIDCFSESLTSVFGEKLKEQVEERLHFYETGDVPRKNVEVMSEALTEHNNALKLQLSQAKKRKHELTNDGAEEGIVGAEEVPKKKKKKKKQEAAEALQTSQEEVTETVAAEVTVSSPGEKKKKKKKVVDEVNGEEIVEKEPEPETPKKKKKKKKSLQPDESSSGFFLDVNGEKESQESNELNDEESMGQEPAQETPKKKKKKKKSLQPDELSSGFFLDVEGEKKSQESAELNGEPAQETPKKKKKKKSLQPDEQSSSFFIDVNGEKESLEESAETPKKKKKKKKSISEAM